MAIPTKKKKFKHNYTSELELKSLLIRIKNDRGDIGTDRENDKIRKYIRWHTAMVAKKYAVPSKRNKLKNKLKARIIELSEGTRIDPQSYERFGEIILLMIKNILKKPQFSGYTYKDDFYSDAVYKILKYLHNFNHLLISERTGLKVNAFAYISQIIHNSILFIINTKKKAVENHKKQIAREATDRNINLKFEDWYADSDHGPEEIPNPKHEKVDLPEIRSTLHEEIVALQETIEQCTTLEITYPKDYVITFDEYNLLKGLLRGKVCITRAKS